MIDHSDPILLWSYLIAAIIGTTSWRMIGAAICGRIDEQSRLFQWISAVAYAMVAALLIRVLIMPSNQMDTAIDFEAMLIRAIIVMLSFAVWYVTKKSVVLGLATGFICFVLFQWSGLVS